MSLPLNKIWPEVGIRNLVSKLKQVVLPAPLGPIRAWMWPRWTFKFTPLTAVKPLNSLVKFFVSKITPDILSPCYSLRNAKIFQIIHTNKFINNTVQNHRFFDLYQSQP